MPDKTRAYYTAASQHLLRLTFHVTSTCYSYQPNHCSNELGDFHESIGVMKNPVLKCVPGIDLHRYYKQPFLAASFFLGVRIMLGTILGRFSIIYFRGLGLRIRVRVWVRVRARVWVRVRIGVWVRVSVVLWPW